MSLDLSSLEKAFDSLSRALEVASTSEQMEREANEKEVIQAGVIQNFEFTYELCWKFMKRWLEKNLGGAYVDGVTRRELFRLAAEQQLVSNVENWMLYHDARNETAHTYNEAKAEEIFLVAQQFLPDAKELLGNLKRKND